MLTFGQEENPWFLVRKKEKPRPPPPININQDFPTKMHLYISHTANKLYSTRNADVSFLQPSTLGSYGPETGK